MRVLTFSLIYSTVSTGLSLVAVTHLVMRMLLSSLKHAGHCLVQIGFRMARKL